MRLNRNGTGGNAWNLHCSYHIQDAKGGITISLDQASGILLKHGDVDGKRIEERSFNATPVTTAMEPPLLANMKGTSFDYLHNA